MDLINLIKNAPKLQEVARLARSGQKKAAAQLFREIFPVEMEQAYAAVEAMAEGRPVDAREARELTGLTPAAPPPPGPSESELTARVLELARQDKKIEAIQLLRKHTTLGLKEAKDAVEDIAAGRPVPLRMEPVESSPPSSGDAPETVQQVIDLLQQERKVEAVKVYRQHFDVSLNEAVKAVQALEALHPGPARPPEPAAPKPLAFPRVKAGGFPRTNPQPPSVLQEESSGRGCLIAAVVLTGLGLLVSGVWLLMQ